MDDCHRRASKFACAFDGVVYTLAFSPDGKTLAASRGDGKLSMVDTATWKTGIELGCARILTFSPNGRYLAVLNEA